MLEEIIRDGWRFTYFLILFFSHNCCWICKKMYHNRILSLHSKQKIQEEQKDEDATHFHASNFLISIN